jgi:hypothetical protein
MEKVEYRGKEYFIKYRHERDIDEDGNPEQRGGKTVAYIVLAWKEDGSILDMMLAEAECSKHDIFSKKLGRTIARGRLLKDIKMINDGCMIE